MGSPAKDRYYIPLPVYASGNVYLNGARPWNKETDPVTREGRFTFALEEKEGTLTLRSDIGKALAGLSVSPVSSDTLEPAFEPEQRFEAPDGGAIVFDTDFLGNQRGENAIPGPFAAWGEAVQVL